MAEASDSPIHPKNQSQTSQPRFVALLGADDHVPSRQEWIDRAGDEYPIVRVALELFRFDQEGLRDKIAKNQETSLQIFELVTSLKEKWKNGVDMLEAMEARLLLTMADVAGVEVPQDGASVRAEP